MTPPAAYISSAELEALLGDPFDPGNPLSVRQFMAWDEAEEYPAAGVARLREFGFQRYLIPGPLGGLLRTFEETLHLVRVVCRRDMTMIMGFGSTLVGSIPIWMWGSEAQRRAAADMLEGGAFGAMGFSEDRAGNDVLATETTATAVDGGYLLTGQKWLIGNATRAEYVSVLARYGADLSFFFVRKRDLAPDSFRHLPKIKTLGLRGHDLSGVAFEGSRLDADGLLGPQGRGVEMMLRTVQITKTLTAGMCLGLVDSALRIAGRYARERRLYGRDIAEIPAIRELLVGSFVDALVCDAVATSAARALTAAPERVSLWSAVAKYHVPVTAERIVKDLSVVLSARFYLRERVAEGMFQKITRDLAITSIFEGTTLLQLSFIHAQLDAINRPRAARGLGRDLQGVDLRDLFSLERAAPAWDPDNPRLKLSNEGQDEILQRFEASARAFQASHREMNGDPEVLERVAELLGRLLEERAAFLQRLQATPSAGAGPSTQRFALARAHCAFHAAAVALYTWLYNRDHIGGEFADGKWLVLALARLLRDLAGPYAAEPPPSYTDDVYRWMMRLEEEGRMFSVLGLPVATAR